MRTSVLPRSSNLTSNPSFNHVSFIEGNCSYHPVILRILGFFCSSSSREVDHPRLQIAPPTPQGTIVLIANLDWVLVYKDPEIGC